MTKPEGKSSVKAAASSHLQKDCPEMTDTITDRAIESIARQFAGGEHRLAGARASELVYGAKKTPNDKLVAKVEKAAPGISRYITPPENPVTTVTDQGGDPLTKQPENDPNQNPRTNMSTSEAQQEQNEIDDALAAGRERGGNQPDGALDVGDTRLNPSGSTDETRTKPVSPKSKAAKSNSKASTTQADKPADGPADTGSTS